MTEIFKKLLLKKETPFLSKIVPLLQFKPNPGPVTPDHLLASTEKIKYSVYL